MDTAITSNWINRPTDMIILVMGVTGSGKSSFISTVIEENVDIIGHNLTSHTSGVEFFMLEYEGDRRVFLMDTPGFDDTYRSNAEVLRDIAFVLAQVYRHKLSVAGVVYMHRITDNRLSGSSIKNLEVLQRLCGPDAFPRVVLTTSMWDSIELNPALLQNAFSHESQLQDTKNFWGSLIGGGSHVMRWTGEKESALSAIGHLIDLHDQRGNIVLKIQRELVDEALSLDDTDSGKTVQDGFVQALVKHQCELRDLLSQFRQAVQESNNDLALELQATIKVTKDELESVQSSQAAIKTSLEQLAEDKTDEYNKVLAQVQEEQRLMIQSMKQYQDDYRRLVDEEKANLEALREAQRESELERLSLADTLSVSSRTEADDKSRLDEFDEELEEQFEEEQLELEGRKGYLDQRMRREQRRMVIKRNSIPILNILAGIGATVGGSLLINPGLIVAGVGLMANGTSKLDFSRRLKREEEEEELLATDSLVSLASTVE